MADKARKQGFSIVQWGYDDRDTTRGGGLGVAGGPLISSRDIEQLGTLEIVSKRERDITILLYSTLQIPYG
jgi:hypothetical protein